MVTCPRCGFDAEYLPGDLFTLRLRLLRRHHRRHRPRREGRRPGNRPAPPGPGGAVAQDAGPTDRLIEDDMRTKDVMTSLVVTVSPDTPLKDVARILVERGINAVPVADASNRLCGIVSEAERSPSRSRRPGRARPTRLGR